MSTFYMYSPTAEQTDKKAQDALSTVKEFTCAVDAETGEATIWIRLHEENIEIKCPFDVAPIQTIGQEDREQYMHIICNAALSVYSNTRQVMNQNTDG